MSCEEVRAQLPDYALGTLSETEIASVRRHLRGCAGCRSEASLLDEGVALFANSAHKTEPPPELRDRVMSVLSDEWSESPGKQGSLPWILGRWPAIVAAAAVIVALGVAVVAQVQETGLRRDAVSYRKFLHDLGGRDVRSGELHPAPSVILEGSVVLYDAEHGRQSWVLVTARAPQLNDPVKVTIRSADGRSIDLRFPLRFDEDGDGWVGFFTSTDLSRFNTVVLTAQDGRVLATGTVREG
jgi:Putative zinc-finger